MAADCCFDIPIDHRLKRYLSGTQIESATDHGSHRIIYEEYGRSLRQSQSRSTPISSEEIIFGSKLAEPDTCGGLLVALMQPGRSQQYIGSFEESLTECATLNYLDHAARTLGSVGLKDITCVDALPFYPDSVKVSNAPPEMRIAYETFLRMIRYKKPDVILCAWKVPQRFGFVQYSSKGVGKVDDTEVISVDGHPIKLVNAFHPSYAINYHPNESCFRRLFVLEMAKAFAELDAGWQEELWMRDLRAYCRQRASELARDKTLSLQGRCQQRFGFVLEKIEHFLGRSNEWINSGNDKCAYDAIIEHQVQLFCCDALLIVSISHECFTVLDKDLKPFPEQKNLVHSVGRHCLRLLRHCVRGRPNKLRGSRGYLDFEDVVITSLPKASGATKTIKSIYGLFSTFLIDLNFSFWPGNKQDWNFDLTNVEAIFRKLTSGIEAKLAKIHAEAKKAEHRASIEGLVQNLGSTNLGD